MGATGHDRYTERLAGTDLSRVLYVYGERSWAGMTTKSASWQPLQGGHVSMFEDPVARQSPPRWPSPVVRLSASGGASATRTVPSPAPRTVVTRLR